MAIPTNSTETPASTAAAISESMNLKPSTFATARVRPWTKVSVAAKVSQASKEGGFLGIGGTRVSPDEDVALKQLFEVLGVKARMPTRP